MARLFTSGFELNSLVGGVEYDTITGTVSIITTTIRSGTYALKANPSATTGNVLKQVYTANQSTQIGYLRVYINVSVRPTTNPVGICSFTVIGGSNRAIVLMQNDGTLVLRNSTNVQIGSASSAVALNTWNYVELKADSSTNPGTFEARLNGVVFASGNDSAGANTFACIKVGNSTANETYTMFFDDVAMNDNTTSTDNSYPDASVALLSTTLNNFQFAGAQYQAGIISVTEKIR